MVSKFREAELEKEGWSRQFTSDEPRLSEVVELYKSLGFEVHLRYKTIYTRPVEGGDSEEALDLWGEHES